jgi:hypothetical protein
MTTTIYNWAKRSYPKTMSLEAVEALYAAGKLTHLEYEDVLKNVSNL